jgi:hypothetical protein
MRPARWHGHFFSPSPARWRPRRPDGAGSCGKNGCQRSHVVSQRLVSFAEGGNRTDGLRRDRPHRRQHEWTAGRLLHARKNARHGSSALARRALAGDSGRRSPHRYCRDRRADRGPFGNCDGSHGKSACGSLGFALADSIYADHVIAVTDSLVPVPLHSLADSRQQRRLRRDRRLHRRSRQDCLRYNANHALARPPPHRRVRRALPA